MTSHSPTDGYGENALGFGCRKRYMLESLMRVSLEQAVGEFDSLYPEYVGLPVIQQILQFDFTLVVEIFTCVESTFAERR